MSKRDIRKCSFVTMDGQFEFVRMPIGLSAATATFQKAIDYIGSSEMEKVRLLHRRCSDCWKYFRESLLITSRSLIISKCSGIYLQTKEGSKYLIIAVENISSYVNAEPVCSTGASETAKVLIEEVILKFGPPKYSTLDRRTAYTSKVFTEINNIMAIQQKFTTAYHPQSNALAERMIKYMAKKLAMYINTDETN